jgi:hypothetical protein
MLAQDGGYVTTDGDDATQIGDIAREGNGPVRTVDRECVRHRNTSAAVEPRLS